MGGKIKMDNLEKIITILSVGAIVSGATLLGLNDLQNSLYPNRLMTKETEDNKYVLVPTEPVQFIDRNGNEWVTRENFEWVALYKPNYEKVDLPHIDSADYQPIQKQ